jgi:hypothetical protein
METDNPTKAELWLRLPEVIQKIETDIELLKTNQIGLTEIAKALVSPSSQKDQYEPLESDRDFEVAYQ